MCVRPTIVKKKKKKKRKKGKKENPVRRSSTDIVPYLSPLHTHPPRCVRKVRSAARACPSPYVPSVRPHHRHHHLRPRPRPRPRPTLCGVRARPAGLQFAILALEYEPVRARATHAAVPQEQRCFRLDDLEGVVAVNN